MVYASEWSAPVLETLFAPEGFGTVFTLDDADDLIAPYLDESLAEVLLPLCLVDEGSIACVAISDEIAGLEPGSVVRLHLDGKVAAENQLRLLDIDPALYISSLEAELAVRKVGLDRVLDEIGPAYEETYLENEKRPRDFIVRPMRIACQNVIVALGAIAQDSSFDGLSAPAWQTCEVPHVAAHEANRALAALTLADAFQNGGTMEIRFDRPVRVTHGEEVLTYPGHPEGTVPASLRRFGRTVGVALGEEDPGAISPPEARDLFLAITPMPAGLRARVDDATERRGVTPERLCFTLLSQVWRESELDFILACSTRAGSILEGGADWRSRSARQAEMEVCRAALMTGMLHRRLNGHDSAGAEDGARVVEDISRGVVCEVLDELGAVAFDGLDLGGPLPWGGSGAAGVKALTVFPRTFVDADTAREVNRMQAEGHAAAVAVPRDADVEEAHLEAPVLRCPDRIADLDKQAEDRLLTARISRS
jgi:hypothetical protein